MLAAVIRNQVNDQKSAARSMMQQLGSATEAAFGSAVSAFLQRQYSRILDAPQILGRGAAIKKFW